MSKESRIAQAVSNIIARNKKRIINMPSYTDVPNTKVPDTHGQKQPGGIAGDIKPVDRKTLEGSTPGDHRGDPKDVQMPNNPAPRDGMTQSKVGPRE